MNPVPIQINVMFNSNSIPIAEKPRQERINQTVSHMISNCIFSALYGSGLSSKHPNNYTIESFIDESHEGLTTMMHPETFQDFKQRQCVDLINSESSDEYLLDNNSYVLIDNGLHPHELLVIPEDAYLLDVKDMHMSEVDENNLFTASMDIEITITNMAFNADTTNITEKDLREPKNWSHVRHGPVPQIKTIIKD